MKKSAPRSMADAQFFLTRAHWHKMSGDRTRAFDDFSRAASLFASSRSELDFAAHVYCVNSMVSLRPGIFSDRFKAEVIPTNAGFYDESSSEFDFKSMGSQPSEGVLKFLIQQRIISIEKCFASASNEDTYYEKFNQLVLINPLLLASAIGVSIAKGYDYKSILHHYISGAELRNLEEHLLRLKDFDQPELAHILEIEEQYTDAFSLLSLESILFSEIGKLYFPSSYTSPTDRSASSLYDCFQLLNVKDPRISYNLLQWLNIHRLPSNWDFNAFHVHLHSWILANPILLPLGRHAADLYLVKHGFEINSRIHNVREYYEYELNNSRKRMNAILESKMTREEKRGALEKVKVEQANLAKLVERGNRLYYWNPMEASAKAFVGQHTPELMDRMKAEEDDAKPN